VVYRKTEISGGSFVYYAVKKYKNFGCQVNADVWHAWAIKTGLLRRPELREISYSSLRGKRMVVEPGTELIIAFVKRLLSNNVML